MIKAEELRIGNLLTDEFYNLYDGKFNTIISVESLDKYGINLYLDNDGNIAELMDSWIEPLITFNNLFPIPLTEEWLIRMGFIDGFLKTNCGRWYYSNGFITVELDNGMQHYDMMVDIDYVHQLQNLYFSLIGEELTIKNNK